MRCKNGETRQCGDTNRASNLSNTYGVFDMSSIATAVSTINVPFHGSDLYVVSVGNEAYTPMRPIIDGMGLTYQGQADKLKSRFSKGVREIMIPTKGGEQTMLCLALRKLNGWLQTISPNKVKPEIRETVIQYQEECDDVLYEYWTKGQVTNPRKVKKIAAGKITADQQEAIKQLVMNRGKALPKEKQAKAMITMWSSLKSHFGCSYKDIGEGQFTEALSLAARVPLEGEFLGKQEALTAPKLEINFPLEWFQVNSGYTGFKQRYVTGDRAQLSIDMLIEAPSPTVRLLNMLQDAGYDVTAPYMEIRTLKHIMTELRWALGQIDTFTKLRNSCSLTFRL